MSCVNCGRKGHMADVCRQPKVDRSQQPCFNCGKTGHQSRACPDRKAPIKALEAVNAGLKPAICCAAEIVDADGFRLQTRRGPRRQGQILADFIRPMKQQSTNRFRPLTVGDIAEACSAPVHPTCEVASPGWSSPLLMRQGKPKLVEDLPVFTMSEIETMAPLRPSSQGEKSGGLVARPSSRGASALPELAANAVSTPRNLLFPPAVESESERRPRG